MSTIARNALRLVNFQFPVRVFTYFSKFSTAPIKKSENEIPAYSKETELEYKVAKKYTIKTLENLLEIRPFQAHEIATKYANLCKIPSLLIRENYKKLHDHGVSKEAILKHPEILSETDLSKKLDTVKKLQYKIEDVLSLIQLSIPNLSLLVENESDRISTLSENLNISVERACELICKKQFLMHISPEKLAFKIKHLKSFGIKPEDICNDLWVLRYSDKIVTNRLTEARNFKVDTMKTWMVRAQPQIFQNYIKRRSDNKLILGNSSLSEYLSHRLECSVEFANHIIQKHPALKNKSLKKLRDLIEFLYSAGFKPNHICRVPKILVHSVETTRKRLKQLEDKGFQIDSLYMLTKSQKQFNQYFEALLKSKNKIKSLS